VLFDEFPEAEPLGHFADQNQAAVRANPRSLKVQFQGGIEGKLKGPIFFSPTEFRLQKGLTVLAPVSMKTSMDSTELRPNV